MDSIFHILNYPLDIFIRLLDKTDTFPFYIGMFSIFCIYRFLIKPLVGGLAHGRTPRSESRTRNKSKESVNFE